MKKLLFTLAFASVAGIVAAQQPTAGTMGFTAGLNGITGTLNSGPSSTGSLMFKYYLSDGLAARVGFNITSGPGKTSVSDTSGGKTLQTTTVNTGGKTWGLSLGAQKSLAGSDKLDVYVGGDLYFGGSTSAVKDVKDEQLKDAGAAKAGDYKQVVTTSPGSFNFGLNGVVGFQYFLVQNLSVGAEFAYGFRHTGSSGSDEIVTTAVAGGTSVTVPTVKSNENKSTSTNTFGKAGGLITLSWYFGGGSK